MEMGLCFLCDKPFAVEHQSAHKNVQFIVMEKEEDEPEHEEASQQLNFGLPTTVPIKTPQQEKCHEFQEITGDSQRPFICNQQTPRSTQKHNLTRELGNDFSRIDGLRIDAREHQNEDQKLNLSLSTATTTTVPIETPFPSDSTPFFFDPPLTNDDVTKKLQIANNPATDPTSEHQFVAPTEIVKTHLHKPLSEGEYFADVAYSSSMVTEPLSFPLRAMLNPTETPPPEPPDRVAVLTPSLNPSRSVTTTKGLAATQYPRSGSVIFPVALLPTEVLLQFIVANAVKESGSISNYYEKYLPTQQDITRIDGWFVLDSGFLFHQASKVDFSHTSTLRSIVQHASLQFPIIASVSGTSLATSSVNMGAKADKVRNRTLIHNHVDSLLMLPRLTQVCDHYTLLHPNDPKIVEEDLVVRWISRKMWINLYNFLEITLFKCCVCYNPKEESEQTLLNWKILVGGINYRMCEIALFWLGMMYFHLGHPKPILELLMESVYVYQQPLFVILSGPLWRAKNLAMALFGFNAQRSAAKKVMLDCSGIALEAPSLQNWLDIVRERGFNALGFLLFILVVCVSKNWVGTIECTSILRSSRFRARLMNFGSMRFESSYLIVPGSSVGAHELMRINDGKKKEAPNDYGPKDTYLSCGVSLTSYFQVVRSCTSLFDATRDIKGGGDSVVRSDSPLKEATGERLVLFQNLELKSLKQQELNFKLILQHHEDGYISVIISECQICLVVAVFHRKMIDWGCVRVRPILLKWKTLPPKHGTWEYSSLRTKML